VFNTNEILNPFSSDVIIITTNKRSCKRQFLYWWSNYRKYKSATQRKP